MISWSLRQGWKYSPQRALHVQRCCRQSFLFWLYCIFQDIERLLATPRLWEEWTWNLKTNYRRAFSTNSYRMEISESLFWGCYVAFCGQAMRVLAEEPCFLCHFHWYNFKLILMFYSSVFIFISSGELQGDGHRAERLREPLWPAWNSPRMHQDWDKVWIFSITSIITSC